MRIVRILLITLFIVISIEAATVASSIEINVEYNSTASFLKIVTGARGVALGESITAGYGDSNQLYLNPAGLAYSQKQFHMTHIMQEYMDVMKEGASVTMPLGEKAGMGLSVEYLNMGSVDQTDMYGVPTGETASAYDYAGTIGGGIALGDKFLIGAAVKYINSYLVGSSASTVAFDMGLMFINNHFEKKVSVNSSIGVRNLGFPIALNGFEEALPMEFYIGSSFIINNLGIYATAIIESYLDEEEIIGLSSFSVCAGVEYSIRGNTSLRVGEKLNYYSFITDDYTGSSDSIFLYGLSFGIGQEINRFVIDYAILPFRSLGMYHVASVSYKF